MHVVIMGCGRVGASLASGLERLGHEVAVIDRDPQAFRRLGPDFRGRQVVGFGFHRSVLDEAGLDAADAFAAVSSGDNSNIIAARVARESYGVEKVVARIYDAKRAAVYERLGIPTVATVPWTTDRLLRMLLPDGVATAWREPTGTVAVLPLPLHEDWVGRPVRDLERATNSRVAFVVRFGTGVLPTKDTTVQAEDTVYVAAISGTVSDVTAAAAAPPEED
ncbi:TrkA family potassium uptake protein [Pseudonocardia sp. C8]|uniref:potassium channel family protein n=1 Tax=Pseudonocardia sp. C8 TaxID=2762759 RepID=UPI001642E5EC|nr:TrkA family potassium uptake protein [Pseudonocardia sp. C8]MBC3191561.1 TrkA family potassium uptake protein [Pseudonocardia sp. C8]